MPPHSELLSVPRLARLRRPALCALLLSILALNISASPDPVPGLPSSKAFQKAILQTIASYPTDGTHDYYWPKKSTWKGTTRDLSYQGELIAKGDEKGRCYCCGLTFEVFFRAYEACVSKPGKPWAIGGLKAKDMSSLISAWFGADGNRRCAVNAIVKFGLGVEIKNPADARPGDILQIWRGDGSGHSAIFMGAEKDAKGTITAIQYWSTQKSSRGIGRRSEALIRPEAGITKGLKPDEIYIARLGSKS